MNHEQQRLEEARSGRANWRLWGPYLSERAWGTVREDYSADGAAWEYFSHDQARSRAYRWSEDGLGGLCDEQQRLCFALALWNGRDPILKERAFGLTGKQGNHGEDVKEYYFYVDATPSQAYLKYQYKYPQAEYPYAALLAENARRTRQEPPYSLLDTGVFKEDRYWDIEIEYAKSGIDCLHVRIRAFNRGPVAANLHLLPTLWFRNTWSWGDDPVAKPTLSRVAAPADLWAVQAEHATLGTYYLYGRAGAELLFTDNETNCERLWQSPNASPYVKDAFHRCVIAGETSAVNSAHTGTKFAAWSQESVAAGASTTLELVLSAQPLMQPFAETQAVINSRLADADRFYGDLLAGITAEDQSIARQAFAGMIWSKQFYHYDVHRWLDGDGLKPPESRWQGRNHAWLNLHAADVISMPDTWEYPWFASWDLAFHSMVFSLIDIDFAKQQLELLLKENYLHPNGQIPAYEWSFSDTNPPVQAAAVLEVFRAEAVQRGQGDYDFLHRMFHKLLLNYGWWLNREDADDSNVFEGGFLGLDNISVFDRSEPLPAGFHLKQSDSTGWMAMFSLNLTVIALELATQNRDYEDIALHCYKQFMAIANTIAGFVRNGLALWDPDARFFMDLMLTPDGSHTRIDVFSWVGLIPLFACEVIDERLLSNAPRFRAALDAHAGGILRGNIVSACPSTVNAEGKRLLSLVDTDFLQAIITRLIDEAEFLSPHGIRSVSRIHAQRQDLGLIPGVGRALIEYIPGESTSGLFGGNSNWRGPVWMPTNYVLSTALEKFHGYFGEDFKQALPAGLSLVQVADLIAGRLIGLFRRDALGLRPCMPAESPFQDNPHWRDLHQFFEYFHGDTGLGLGASHQTGWTGLVANLIYRQKTN